MSQEDIRQNDEQQRIIQKRNDSERNGSLQPEIHEAVNHNAQQPQSASNSILVNPQDNPGSHRNSSRKASKKSNAQPVNQLNLPPINRNEYDSSNLVISEAIANEPNQ